MRRIRRVILFCDISGFMRLAGSLGEGLPGFVQEFYETAGDAIVGCGGTLVKYIGDAILSVFASGRESDAVRCALRLRRAFSALVHRCVPGAEARLEVAISSGEVVQGTFGHPSLRLEDVMGDAVAHAAVLNRVPGIVVTEAVKNALGGAFPLKELPPLAVKWESKPLPAWQIVEE